MKITIKGLDQLKDRMGNMANLLPKAVHVALDRTAQQIKDAEVAEMKAVFDRPTRYTLDSLKVGKSTKTDLTATVEFKDAEITKSGNHLAPQILGGDRHYKRFERVLRAAGILPQGMYAMPARDAWLDQHGNITGPEIVQILSSLKAFGETGYLMNKTGKSRSKTKNRYFVKYRAGRPMGIWEVIGAGNTRPVLMFMHAPKYKKRLDFYRVAKETATANLTKNVSQAIQDTIKWSKGK